MFFGGMLPRQIKINKKSIPGYDGIDGCTTPSSWWIEESAENFSVGLIVIELGSFFFGDHPPQVVLGSQPMLVAVYNCDLALYFLPEQIHHDIITE